MLQIKDTSFSANQPERRHPLALRQAPPPRVVELANLDDFRRLVERQGLRCRRDGEAFSALSLLAESEAGIADDVRLALLSDCARRLCGRVRSTDTVARWQDSHFGILLPGCPPMHAAGVVTRLVKAAGGQYNINDHKLRLRIEGTVFAPALI